MNDSVNRAAIKEAFFAAGNAMLSIVLSELGELYPVTCRFPSMPLFNPTLKDEYDRKLTKARSFLYEQRNLVQDKWLMRYHIEKSAATDTVPNRELQALLIHGALDRLYENLVAYVPVIFPPAKCLGIDTAVKMKLGFESDRLIKILARYDATYMPNVEPIESELE